MVRNIFGKPNSTSHQHLNINSNGGAEAKATTKKDIADTLRDAFCKSSSNRHHLNNSETTKYIKKRLN